jgi:uncharacterized protein (DUF1778 family)
MNYDTTLFRESEIRSTTLTLRLSPAQKACIYDLARLRGTSLTRFVLALIAQECDLLNNTKSQSIGL